MTDVDEIKPIVRALMQENPSATMKLVELERSFYQREGFTLKEAALNLGFESAGRLIRSWSGFTVEGIGFSVLIKVQDVDHIFRMKQYEKSLDDKDVKVEPRFAPLKVPTSLETEQVVTEKLQIPSEVSYAIEKPFEIFLLDSRNPHRFWFAEYTEYKEAKKLMAEMRDFFTDDKNEYKINKETLSAGMIVTAKYGTIWHRGKVLQITGEHWIRVLYVDFGTVADVGIDEIRCLPEKFATMPAIAHRGVLCHVQPRDGKWSDESHNFFMIALANKKIECKIIHRNSSDRSYYIAMRATIEEHGEKKVISDLMIHEGHCSRDDKFTDNGVSSSELTFEDYENGKDLKDPCQETEEQPEQKEDEWWVTTPAKESTSSKSSEEELVAAIVQSEPTDNLSGMQVSPSSTPCSFPLNQSSSPISSPLDQSSVKNEQIQSITVKFESPLTTKVITERKPFTQFKRLRLEVPKTTSTTSLTRRPETPPNASVSSHTSPPPVAKLVDEQLESTPKVFQEVRSRQHNKFMESIKRAGQVKTPKSSVAPVPLQTRIFTQNLDSFVVGTKKSIYIQAADTIDCFYFYIKDEFAGIMTFLQDLNEICDNNVAVNKDFSIGNDIVTYADENYCRGRIVEKLECENSYKIFLVDFGFFVDRPMDEIFKLNENFKKRQPAVYKGKLAIVPEHAYIQTLEQLLQKVNKSKPFIEVKVTRIDNDSVELLLLN